MEIHGINLEKGQSCAVERGIERVMVGCGWDPIDNGQTFDLDVSCVLLDREGRMPSRQHYIYYNCLKFMGDVIVHTGDNLTGDGDGDDERMLLDLSRIPAEVAQVDVYCSIYRGREKGQSFGMISNCYLRMVDITAERDTSTRGPLYNPVSYPDREFCRFQLNEEAMHCDCVLMGTLLRDVSLPSVWHFNSVQKDVYGGMDAVLERVAPRQHSPLTLVTRQMASRDIQAYMPTGEGVFRKAVESRFAFVALGVGALLLNTVGHVPLICCVVFMWLSSHANK